MRLAISRLQWRQESLRAIQSPPKTERKFIRSMGGSRDLTNISHHAHRRLKTSSAQPSMLRQEELNGHAHAGSRLPFREICLTTSHPTEFIDLTDRLNQFIAEADVCVGVLNVQTSHTTAAIVVNEHEPLLLADFKALLERHGPESAAYRPRRHVHGGWMYRSASRPNGHAHCRALLLPTSALPQRSRRPPRARVLAARLPCGAGRSPNTRGVGRCGRGVGAMKVKMILPALTEATSPFWRPIECALFHPSAWRRWPGSSTSTQMSRSG